MPFSSLDFILPSLLLLMTAFDVYVEGQPDAPYSTLFFESLTFKDVLSLQLPPAAPEGTLICWVFLSTVPFDANGVQVAFDETIPPTSDLLPISTEILTKFSTEGMRSIALTYCALDGAERSVVYHFAKVCISLTYNYH